MAFNYENPHDDPNLGNYDYYVNEVKDFQRKLDEYQESVDQKLADQDADIANLQNQVNGQINGLRNEVRDFEERITDEVDSINEHTETYVNNYLTENINTILEDNPVLDTIYQRVGVVEPNQTITISDLTSDIIDIVILDNSLNHARFFANNTTNNLISVTQDYTDVVIGERTLSVATLPQFTTRLMVTNVNNNVVISNSGSNNLTVYKKRFN